MITLTAPETITVGTPFSFSYTAEARVAGRVRLTAGTEAVSITLTPEGKEPMTGTALRVRGRSGSFTVSDWGEHASGTELVLRFEGAKAWLTVA